MNRPPEEFKRIAAAALCDFTARCLKAAGMAPAHAEQLAQLLTHADLRGVRSHGTRAAVGYCQSLRSGQINPAPAIRIVEETDTAVLVDGDGGLGYAPMMLATERAIAKAREKKIAMGASRHHGHYGSAGHYVRRAMASGCLALSVQGSHPARFGEGGGNQGQAAAYWGNPPICFGFPSQEEPPLVLDAATCILADYQRGPEFDALQALIPAAFFKSMGYTGSATALGGAFVGQSSEEARAVEARWPAARSGGLIIVLDIEAFVPAGEFRRGIDYLVRGVRQTMKPLPGYREATLPGTIEHRNERTYAREGIPIALEDLERLVECGRQLGVEPGW